jgi:hypothetical protein
MELGFHSFGDEDADLAAAIALSLAVSGGEEDAGGPSCVADDGGYGSDGSAWGDRLSELRDAVTEAHSFFDMPSLSSPPQASAAPTASSASGAAGAGSTGAAAAHVFVDHSNVIIPASTGGKVYFDVGALVRIVEAAIDVPIKMRFVGGSKAAGGDRVADALFRAYEHRGYKVHTTERSRGGGETFVDDMIVANINNVLLRVSGGRPTPPGTRLVLLSGDGNLNDGRASFLGAVENALRCGWLVTLWSWQASLSGRYRDLLREFGHLMNVCFFDDHKHTLVRHAVPQPGVSRGEASCRPGPAAPLTSSAASPPGECLLCGNHQNLIPFQPCGHKVCCAECIPVAAAGGACLQCSFPLTAT